MAEEISPVACVPCGIDLGLAPPGTLVRCWKCSQWIQVRPRTIELGEALWRQ